MKVLLLDAAFSAMPIYDYLVESGHEVWVMSNRPEDILAQRAGERWIRQDYSQVSEVGRHIDRIGIDRLVPGCTDVSIDTCVQFGADYLDDAATNAVLMNKKQFRALCAELRLPAPHAKDAGAFPIAGRFICKPVDAFSGRGISVFNGLDRAGMVTAFNTARRESPSGEALAEPFIEGDLYSYTTFLAKGKPQEWFFVREGSSINPFAVDTSYVSEALPEDCRALLADSITRIAGALSLKDGLIHTQFLWNGREPSIVEVSRRCPGDLYALLIEYSTGFRYAAKYASFFLGTRCEPVSAMPRHVLRHTVTANQAAVFGGLRLQEAMPVKAFFPLRHLGEELAGGHAGRAGVLFCEFANQEEMYAAERRFLSRTAYAVD
jgi:hypothetical protein